MQVVLRNNCGKPHLFYFIKRKYMMNSLVTTEDVDKLLSPNTRKQSGNSRKEKVELLSVLHFLLRNSLKKGPAGS
jgi:hypothetical protein